MFDYKETKFGMAYARTSESLNSDEVVVHFLETGHTCNTTREKWEDNRVIDKTQPYLYGVGFGDVYAEGNPNLKFARVIWYNLMTRALKYKSQTIDPAFYDFTYFWKVLNERKDLKWAVNNGLFITANGFHIDSESLTADGKTYGRSNKISA
ncbi:MAG: hypothetical protein ACRC6V_00675 [Bacteroidales bacterium]